MTIEIISPNNWLKKAGAYIDSNDKLVFPHKFIAVPMTLASEAIVEFRKNKDLASKIKNGLLVVVMVRIADTAFYKKIAEIINQQSPSTPNLCHNCLRGQLWDTKMKTYRQVANRKIIHKMEGGIPINNMDLEIVEKYYNEIFKLPLIDPISFKNKKGLKLCERCKKKFNHSDQF